MLRFVVPGLTVAALLSLAACQQPGQPAVQFDNGQMRPPQPLATGDVRVNTTTQSPAAQNGQMRPPSTTGGPNATVNTTASPAASQNGNMTAPGYGNGLPTRQ